MRTYDINFDQKVKVWLNQMLRIEFDGTEEELRTLIEKNDGDLGFLNPEYLGSEYLFETEELMTRGENEGDPVYEIQDIEEVQST